VIKTTALLRLPERLTLPMAALSAAGLLLCATLAGEQIDSLVNSQLSQQLSTDQRALKGWLAQQTQGLRQSAHWMAQQPQWQQALDGTPPADMQATLDAAAKASGMQWAVLIDQSGKVLSQPTKHPWPSTWPALASSHSGMRTKPNASGYSPWVTPPLAHTAPS